MAKDKKQNINEEEEKRSSFQVFFYLFFIPLVYTAVLLFVLVNIFSKGHNPATQALLDVAKKIPYVDKYATQIDKNIHKDEMKKEEPTPQQVEKEKQDLVSKVRNSKNQVTQLENIVKQKDTNNQDLQKQIEDLNKKLKEKQDAEKDLKIKAQDLAQQYSIMDPKKAAGILDSMDINDAVFIFSEMKVNNKAKILEKMSPQKAGDLTIALKDFSISKDNQINSLQMKIKDLTTSKQVVKNLVQTYTLLPPDRASMLLSEILKTDSKKVYEIMSQMDSNSRAKILSAMIADKGNPDGVKQAAQITKNIIQ